MHVRVFGTVAMHPFPVQTSYLDLGLDAIVTLGDFSSVHATIQTNAIFAASKSVTTHRIFQLASLEIISSIPNDGEGGGGDGGGRSWIWGLVRVTSQGRGCLRSMRHNL